MNKIYLNNLSDLAEAQRVSFCKLLFFGITQELKELPNPLITKVTVIGKRKKDTICAILNCNEVKIKGPELSLNFCLKEELTYSCQLYVNVLTLLPDYSVLVKSKQQKKKNLLKKGAFQKQVRKILPKKENSLEKKERDWRRTKKTIHHIFLGEIPLMTEEGSFIVNGCERIVISQIIRSPGIYFRKEFGTTRKTIYTATIISNRGPWTKFVLDEKLPTKQAMQTMTDLELVDCGADRIYMKKSDFKPKVKLSRQEADNDKYKIFLFDLILSLGLTLEELMDSIKYPLYLEIQQFPGVDDFRDKYENDDKLYEIQTLMSGYSAPFSIGEIGRYKLNKKLGLNLPKEITHLTIPDFIGIMDGLMELKYYGRVSDDIDDIKNKQIRSVGELVQNQIRMAFYRLSKKQREQKEYVSPKEKDKFQKEINAQLEVTDWILDPRPVTYGVKDFFKTSQLSQFMDQINPLAEQTQKRRISVFGPNGLKRDHISTVIRDIHPSQYGRLCPIETSEGQNAGLVTSIALLGRLGSFGSIETPYFIMQDKTVFNQKRPVYLTPEEESELRIAFCDVSLTPKNQIRAEYLSVKENNLFSVKKTDDISFITISPLQIVSLATALIPFLEHDDANRALMGSNMQRQAVPLLFSQKPLVGTGFEASAILDSGMVIKTYCQGTVLYACSVYIEIQDSSNQIIKYFLRKYYRSNQETCINQRPVVWIGEKVFSGQIIADGPSTTDGELSLGRNLTIAYMPWEGYNYEDAIVINEKLITDNYLTSIHIEEHETTVTYSIEGGEQLTNDVSHLPGSEIVTNDLPHLANYIRRHLNHEGIVKIGSYVHEHDILVGKLSPNDDNSPENNLLFALYGVKNPPKFQDNSLRVPHGTEGRVVEVRVLATSFTPNTNFGDEFEEDAFPEEVWTACEIIRIYIAQIRKIQVGDKLAGRHGNKGIISRILPCQDMPYLPDGNPIDIIFNPLGVPSRMNVGQVLECLLGLAGEKLGKRFKIVPFDEIYGEEASRILVNQKLKEAALKTGCSWLFNPYYPGKILLRDGRTGEFFDNPITVGKSYILKLIHLVEDKIHARSTGPYSMITEQPLAGKAQLGGQRFGEMEVWALEAYGCSHTLQELLTIKSDDIDGRNDMYEAIVSRKEMDKPNPSIPESFLALIRELNALGLEFTLHKFEGGFSSTTNIKNFEKDIFKDLELRLKLRAFLVGKKIERLSHDEFLTKEDLTFLEKQKEKKKLIKNLKNEVENF
jgi:DNA-directed RNA polymerase subunit beta